jgi:RecG-like helicase
VPIATVSVRDRVTLAGRVTALRVQPRAGIATLQCTVADRSGEILVIFLGRRHVGGWEPGALVSVSGIVGERGGRKEILNPDYRLLAPLH